MKRHFATNSLCLLLLTSCTVAGHYRREGRHIERMRDSDFSRGILRADPNYYLNRHLGLPVLRALLPPRKRHRAK